MECEKCKDVGFIEYEAGLVVQFCDCEAGKKAEAKQREILGYPETPPGPIMNEQFQSSERPEYLIIPEAIPGKTIDETVDIARKIIESQFQPEGVKNDSVSGDKSDTQSSAKSIKPRKRRNRKKKAG